MADLVIYDRVQYASKMRGLSVCTYVNWAAWVATDTKLPTQEFLLEMELDNIAFGLGSLWESKCSLPALSWHTNVNKSHLPRPYTAP